MMCEHLCFECGESKVNFMKFIDCGTRDYMCRSCRLIWIYSQHGMKDKFRDLFIRLVRSHGKMDVHEIAEFSQLRGEVLLEYGLEDTRYDEDADDFDAHVHTDNDTD